MNSSPFLHTTSTFKPSNRSSTIFFDRLLIHFSKRSSRSIMYSVVNNEVDFLVSSMGIILIEDSRGFSFSIEKKHSMNEQRKSMSQLPLLLLEFESKLGVGQRKFVKRRHEPFSLLSKIHSGLSAGIRHLIACSYFEPKYFSMNVFFHHGK